MYGFLCWNLFLAWIPWLAGQAFRTSSRRRAAAAWQLGWLGLWLLFLPNAPYILTDLLHLASRPPVPLWFDLALLLSCAGTGLLLGYSSLLEVQAAVEERFGRVMGWAVAAGSLFLSGFGIYLGRFRRWNSWQALTDPAGIFGDISDRLLDPMSYPRTYGVTMVFGGGLLLGYAALRLLTAHPSTGVCPRWKTLAAPFRPPESTPGPPRPCQNGIFRPASVLRRLTHGTEIPDRRNVMKVPSILIPLLLLAGAMSLAAQGPAPAATKVEGMEVGESIDVRVVNVEAVVTDRHGQRLKGLKPTDFRLLVDGKEVPVDYFTEIRGGTAVDGPASPVSGTVGRNLLIFVDQSYTIQAQLDMVLRRLEEDLDRLTPGDQIALVAADREGHLKILTDWTSDAGRLRAAIAQVRQEPTGGARLRVALESLDNDRVLRNMVETGNVWGESSNLERSEVGHWWDLRSARQPRSLSVLEHDVAAENSEAAIWADDTFGTSALAAMRAFSSAPGRKVMLLFSGGWPGGEDPRIIEAANLLGYSLYPVDVSGLQASAVPLDASKVGLAREDANASYGFITSGWEQRVHGGFEALARETGGKASLNGLRETALDRALDDTEAYYWLGFSPTWNADGKKHDIRLEVRNSGLHVRARRGYSDLSLRAQQALEAQSRRVIAAAGSGTR